MVGVLVLLGAVTLSWGRGMFEGTRYVKRKRQNIVAEVKLHEDKRAFKTFLWGKYKLLGQFSELTRVSTPLKLSSFYIMLQNGCQAATLGGL